MKIREVCDRCGLEANRLTCIKKFGTEPFKKKCSHSNYRTGKCDYCGETKLITSVKDFYNPDFSLLTCQNKKSIT